MTTSEKNLRNALKSNALFSLMSGMGLIGFHEKVGQVMNISDTFVLQLIGIGLLLFVALLLYSAFRKKLDIRQVKFIIIQDWAWVIGSIVLVIFDPLEISPIGNVLIAVMAAVVALLAILQMKALSKLVR